MTLNNVKPLAIPAPDRSMIHTLAGELIWRQSLTGDIITCPKMTSYRWIFEFQNAIDSYGNPKVPMLAAILGTAGHAVIEKMHVSRRLDYGLDELIEMMEQAIVDARADEQTEAPTPAGYDSMEHALECKAIEYTELVFEYQKMTKAFNPKLHVSMTETLFVLPVSYKGKTFIFSGTLDQGGAYGDGLTVLRDLKFRDNAFKPNKVQRILSHQFGLYATAMKFGVPACNNCRPKYVEDLDEDTFAMTRRVQYDGPCDECSAKIGTPKWPGFFPEQCELVWMKDLVVLKKNFRGRMKGDYKGDVLYKTRIKRDRAIYYLQDILEYAHTFQQGYFPRNPGQHCYNFCDYRHRCVSEILNESVEQVKDNLH